VNVRNTCRVWLGKRLVERSRGRPGMRWEINIKTGLREMDFENGKWIEVAHDHIQCGLRC